MIFPDSNNLSSSHDPALHRITPVPINHARINVARSSANVKEFIEKYAVRAHENINTELIIKKARVEERFMPDTTFKKSRKRA